MADKVWTPEQEQEIEMATEVRVRANRRIREENEKEEQKKRCKRGEHEFDNKKCVHCKADEPVKEPPKQKSKWSGL